MAFQSPQWGSNSKTIKLIETDNDISFSPRNGEVILNS